jgi:hypothetical protein
MNHFRGKFTLWAAALCLLLTATITPVLTMAQTSSSDTSASDPAKKSKKKPKKARATASAATAADSGKKVATSPASPDAEIAAARASGKVWVNLDSGIYHKGGRWYGKTKNGKFMTEAEAKAAGYKASQRD